MPGTPSPAAYGDDLRCVSAKATRRKTYYESIGRNEDGCGCCCCANCNRRPGDGSEAVYQFKALRALREKELSVSEGSGSLPIALTQASSENHSSNKNRVSRSSERSERSTNGCGHITHPSADSTARFKRNPRLRNSDCDPLTIPAKFVQCKNSLRNISAVNANSSANDPADVGNVHARNGGHQRSQLITHANNGDHFRRFVENDEFRFIDSHTVDNLSTAPSHVTAYPAYHENSKIVPVLVNRRTADEDDDKSCFCQHHLVYKCACDGQLDQPKCCQSQTSQSQHSTTPLGLSTGHIIHHNNNSDLARNNNIDVNKVRSADNNVSTCLPLPCDSRSSINNGPDFGHLNDQFTSCSAPSPSANNVSSVAEWRTGRCIYFDKHRYVPPINKRHARQRPTATTNGTNGAPDPVDQRLNEASAIDASVNEPSCATTNCDNEADKHECASDADVNLVNLSNNDKNGKNDQNVQNVNNCSGVISLAKATDSSKNLPLEVKLFNSDVFDINISASEEQVKPPTQPLNQCVCEKVSSVGSVGSSTDTLNCDETVSGSNSAITRVFNAESNGGTYFNSKIDPTLFSNKQCQRYRRISLDHSDNPFSYTNIYKESIFENCAEPNCASEQRNARDIAGSAVLSEYNVSFFRFFFFKGGICR